jgi:hypothetical protein
MPNASMCQTSTEVKREAVSRRGAGYVGALLGAMVAIDGDTVRVDGNGYRLFRP